MLTRDGGEVSVIAELLCERYTVLFRIGDALNRTVFPAFTLIDAPVLGSSAFRAFVLRTMKVPKLGSVNLPVFFISLTTASIKSAVARFAVAPLTSADR
jgi:hypothetical protein